MYVHEITLWIATIGRSNHWSMYNINISRLTSREELQRVDISFASSVWTLVNHHVPPIYVCIHVSWSIHQFNYCKSSIPVAMMMLMDSNRRCPWSPGYFICPALLRNNIMRISFDSMRSKNSIRPNRWLIRDEQKVRQMYMTKDLDRYLLTW